MPLYFCISKLMSNIIRSPCWRLMPCKNQQCAVHSMLQWRSRDNGLRHSDSAARHRQAELAAGEGNNGGFVQDDAAAFDIDERIRSAEVDRQVSRGSRNI